MATLEDVLRGQVSPEVLTDLDEVMAAHAAGTLATLVTQVTALETGAATGVKEPVRAATTVNGTLATAFAAGQVIDGVTLVAADRILLRAQSTGAQNGIYTVNATGAPT
jgi:hypothetical protein